MQNAKRLRIVIISKVSLALQKKETFQLQHLLVSLIKKCFNFLIRLKTGLRFMKWTLVITQGRAIYSFMPYWLTTTLWAFSDIFSLVLQSDVGMALYTNSTVAKRIKCFFYTLWKKCRLKSTFPPYRVKKHHSTLEMDTFKFMLRLSYLASLDNKPRTWL